MADMQPTNALDRNGWVVLETQLDRALIDRLNAGLDHAYRVCRNIQKRNGVDVNTDGTVHHVLSIDPCFLELLDRLTCVEQIEHFFRGKFILNSYGGVLNMKDKGSYVCNVHRDMRTFSGDLPLMLNMLLMLDDFTLENGATYLLTGSHKVADKPNDTEFFARAERAVGRAGMVLLFNSNLWHAAGRNSTDSPRRALTLTFTKPFIKQQLDYPRDLGYSRAEGLSEQLKQIIGYNARVPANLDEWYQPPEKRMYRPGQG